MKPNAKQLANLQPIKKGELDTATLKKRGSNGGKRSQEVQRAKRNMRDTLKLLLELQTGRGSVDPDTIKTYDELQNAKLTVEQAMLMAQIQKAVRGDTAAFIAIRDTSGNKPTDTVNMIADTSSIAQEVETYLKCKKKR